MTQTSSRKLGAFLVVSLDGYYCDLHGDMSFAHKPPDDAEWYEFVGGNAKSEDTLLFGRVTYDMMAAWWPTPTAAQMMPEIAAGMNSKPKVVFSRTMRSADWDNTTVVAEDVVAAVRRMKGEPGPDLMILGSGSIVTPLGDAGLIDSLQIVVTPVAIGAGKSLLSGLTKRLDFVLTDTRVFGNGSVVLWYAPRASARAGPQPVAQGGPLYRPPQAG
jgi:dihydrofolate reductase